ncbi:unnamed protein product, partial [Prorocentrum cordatum]
MSAASEPIEEWSHWKLFRRTVSLVREGAEHGQHSTYKSLTYHVAGQRVEFRQPTEGAGTTLMHGDFARKLSPSEEALTFYMTKHPKLFKGARVLVAGAGLGLAGLAIAACTRAAHVELTDGDAEVVSTLKESTQLNSNAFGNTTVSVRKVLWDRIEDWPARGSYDLVVAADVVYLEFLHSALLGMVSRVLRPGATFLLFASRRNGSLEKFTSAAKAFFPSVEAFSDYDDDVGHAIGRTSKCFPIMVRLVAAREEQDIPASVKMMFEDCQRKRSEQEQERAKQRDRVREAKQRNKATLQMVKSREERLRLAAERAAEDPQDEGLARPRPRVPTVPQAEQEGRSDWGLFERACAPGAEGTGKDLVYECGGCSVTVRKPDGGDFLYGELARRVSASEEVLTHWVLKNRRKLKRKRVLELGAGVGLAGLTAGVCAAAKQVDLTDGDPRMVATMQESVALNGGAFQSKKVSVRRLVWGEDDVDAGVQYDWIIGADPFESGGSPSALLKTVRRLLKPSGTAVFFGQVAKGSMEGLPTTAAGLFDRVEVSRECDAEVTATLHRHGMRCLPQAVRLQRSMSSRPMASPPPPLRGPSAVGSAPALEAPASGTVPGERRGTAADDVLGGEAADAPARTRRALRRETLARRWAERAAARSAAESCAEGGGEPPAAPAAAATASEVAASMGPCASAGKARQLVPLVLGRGVIGEPLSPPPLAHGGSAAVPQPAAAARAVWQDGDLAAMANDNVGVRPPLNFGPAMLMGLPKPPPLWCGSKGACKGAPGTGLRAGWDLRFLKRNLATTCKCYVFCRPRFLFARCRRGWLIWAIGGDLVRPGCKIVRPAERGANKTGWRMQDRWVQDARCFWGGRCSTVRKGRREAAERDAVAQVESVLREAVAQAHDFPLHPSLALDGSEPRSYPKGVAELWDGCGASLPAELQGRAWGTVYKWRCALTFARRVQNLVWLEDKVSQRTLMRQWPAGAGQPLPSRWFAPEDLAEAEAAASHLAAAGAPFVVKPRHAACGQGQTVIQPPAGAEGEAAADGSAGRWESLCWPGAGAEAARSPPAGSGAAAAAADADLGLAGEAALAVRAALAVGCKAGETWQLYQVPRGVGLEPLYPSLGASAVEPLRPLELKVQSIWGRVVGATLHTSQAVWVLPDGRLHRWGRRVAGNKALQRMYGAMPPSAEAALRSALVEHWPHLRSETEAISRRWGLDEVRVDWFVGCPRWGPRICEVTWMGTGDRVPCTLQLAVADAFFAGHRRRLERSAERPEDPPPSAALGDPLESESRRGGPSALPAAAGGPRPSSRPGRAGA